MGYYLNNLKKFNETGLFVWEILCANEVNYMFKIGCSTDVDIDNDEVLLSEHDAEYIIDFVYDWVMNTDATPNEVCVIIYDALKENYRDHNQGLSIDDFKEDYYKCRDYVNNKF